MCGTVIVFVFFLLFAFDSGMFAPQGIMNWTIVSAQFMIIAVGACLLMIAGEFDLSVGSMIGFAGMMIAVFGVVLGWPMWIAILLTFAMCIAIGALNGFIVIRTGLPSFIVTLAFLFILRGLSLVGLKWASGGSTQLRGVRDATENDWLAPVFSGDAFPGLFAWLAERGLVETFKNGAPKVTGIPVEILWFIVLALVATYILLRTPAGNWIFAAGGDSTAASNSGVPVNRVKISLFMVTACCAALVAIITVIDAGSTDARRGFQKEFEAIIAVVIGGADAPATRLLLSSAA